MPAVCALAALLATALACHRPDASARASVRTQLTIGIPSATAPIYPFELSLTTRRLVHLDHDGHAQPGAIDQWTVSPDGRTWTLRIRRGVRLHDGGTLRARHVADLLEAARKDKDRDAGLWPVTGVAAIDDWHLRVDLDQPTSLLLDALALIEGIPSGPYRVARRDARDVPTFEAVADPTSDPIGIDTLALRRYDTPRAAVTALLRQDVDVLYDVPSEARELLAKQKGVRSYAYVKPYVVAFGFNHRHPVLRRREVRRALAIAVDRKALVAETMSGFGIPATDMLWREHWTKPHAADAEAMRVDRPRAERMLDGAGLRRPARADGSAGTRLQIHVLVLDDTSTTRVASRLQRSYAAIGVTLTFEPLPLPRLIARLQAGDFDAFIGPTMTGYGLSRAYLDYGRHDHPRLVNHGYTAAEEAAEAVRLASNDDTFARAVTELHRVLLDDPPAVYLFWQQAERAVGPRVRLPADLVGSDILTALPRWGLTPPEGS